MGFIVTVSDSAYIQALAYVYIYMRFMIMTYLEILRRKDGIEAISKLLALYGSLGMYPESCRHSDNSVLVTS